MVTSKIYHHVILHLSVLQFPQGPPDLDFDWHYNNLIKTDIRSARSANWVTRLLFPSSMTAFSLSLCRVQLKTRQVSALRFCSWQKTMELRNWLSPRKVRLKHFTSKMYFNGNIQFWYPPETSRLMFPLTLLLSLQTMTSHGRKLTLIMSSNCSYSGSQVGEVSSFKNQQQPRTLRVISGSLISINIHTRLSTSLPSTRRTACWPGERFSLWLRPHSWLQSWQEEGRSAQCLL